MIGGVVNPFPLSGAVYLKSPTRRSAAHLDDLTREVAESSGTSLFWHTQMAKLHDPFAEELPWDDLSTWVRGSLQDPETAERIAFAIQSSPTEIESLRANLLDVFESIPAGTRRRTVAPPGGELWLLSLHRAAIPTGVACTRVSELIDHLSTATADVWFHHLIEEAWLLPGETPLIEWMCVAGAEAMANRLEEDVRRGLNVRTLRAAAVGRWRRATAGTRIAAGERKDSGAPSESRQLAARLARRAVRGGESI
ncbi:MAG: DUF5752 family protein [Candidatus Eisenbacteria bacterium]